MDAGRVTCVRLESTPRARHGRAGGADPPPPLETSGLETLRARDNEREARGVHKLRREARCGAGGRLAGGWVASALPSLEAAPVLVSFVYLVACRVLALVL